MAKTLPDVEPPMPWAQNGNVRLRYRTDGDGEDTVVFVPDAGCGAWQWAWQATALAGPVETVVYYPRGTGPSDGPEGPYDLDALTGDLAAVVDAVDAAAVTVVGAGFGGLVALEYAHGHPRVDRTVVLGSSAAGRRFDCDLLFGGPTAFEGLLGDPFVSDRPADVERIRTWRREEDAVGPVANAYRAAVTGADLADRLFEITPPTLVMHGSMDGVVPPNAGRSLAENLPRGEFVPIDGGHHWFFIERARLVTDRIDGFLREPARDR